ncbi:hypothetical protein ACQCVP_04775 [Rossellomorea vietnamensis]|uniref:hypothetical protein n=1 Tax=Rossellomorea vietnamensis TaxID=218284 RepID=UPI003CE733EE
MNYFLKLNGISIIYAITILIPIQLVLNVYRLTRITEWNIQTVNKIIGLTSLLAFLVFSLLLFFLTRKWLSGGKARYLTVVLWLPYYVLFAFLFATLFPITHNGDIPNPASGLLIIGAFIVYPLYIMAMNFFAGFNE